jgi:hypothetical protein
MRLLVVCRCDSDSGSRGRLYSCSCCVRAASVVPAAPAVPALPGVPPCRRGAAERDALGPGAADSARNHSLAVDLRIAVHHMDTGSWLLAVVRYI